MSDDTRVQLEAALAELAARRAEQDRLERELADTNRGVVALYAELDDKAEQLRRADEAKSRFLSGVSHELRTPLNSILALTRLLAERSDGPLTPEQERQVEYIRSSAEELLRLVNSLLDLSRIEAGRSEILIHEFDLADLFRRIEGESQPLLVDRSVQLVVEQPETEIRLVTDEGKVGQIIRNFISNSIKYTEEGTVRLAAVQTPDARVRISVTDTGIGIRQADLGRVFEEFIQLPGPLQTRARGTGLGLTLTRALARVLGGGVGVESEWGKGSTFWAEFPIRHAAAVQPDNGTGGVHRPAPAALVIDDDPVARYVVGQMLRAEGYLVAEATGGIDGLSQAHNTMPGLIVLDLSMPDLDGVSVLARLQEDAATAAIPVIVYSAREITPGESRRLAGHVAAVVSKSGDVGGELREAVLSLGPAATARTAASTRRQP